MVKIINYIIFHFYQFQLKVGNKDVAVFFTSLFLTLVIWFIILSISSFLQVKQIIELETFANYIIMIIACLIFIPIYLILKNKPFLKYNFKESISGYLLLCLVIAVFLSIFVVTANKNRDRLIRQRGLTKELIESIDQKYNDSSEPTSLEGKIKKWYHNKTKKDSIK